MLTRVASTYQPVLQQARAPHPVRRLEAWDYKLGNRSAIEWVLDRYKEKKPKDPTIRAKFNTYRFADYKEEVVTLLQRVCTVSVETVKIVRMMSAEREVKHDDGAA